jgi:hypothetical protein
MNDFRFSNFDFRSGESRGTPAAILPALKTTVDERSANEGGALIEIRNSKFENQDHRSGTRRKNYHAN